MIPYTDLPFKVAVITASLWKMSSALIAADDTLVFALLAKTVFLGPGIINKLIFRQVAEHFTSFGVSAQMTKPI